MANNLEKYKGDLKKLIDDGDLLLLALQNDHYPREVEKQYEANSKGSYAKLKAVLPNFILGYQKWYSEAHAVIAQLLPARLEDFARHYERPKAARKEITSANYVILDALQGLETSRGGQKIVGAEAAVPQLQQQLGILKSVERRFESSLFDIKQLVQADIFDSEIEAARALLKNGFGRAAGAMASVVLEKHLEQVCENHAIKIGKKNPTIGDLNELLKSAGVLEIERWRFIQRLSDVRNLCDHNKKVEPTTEQVSELIEGIDKITKTLF